MKNNQGIFITFEGIEGVGKSTVLNFLQQELILSLHQVICTREPGGTPLAEAIRQVILHHDGEALTDIAELLLLFAGRAQHIQNVIRPALLRNEIVLCDRFIDATYAYQGGGRGLAIEQIHLLEKLVLGDLKPDKTFLLDAPIDVGLARVKARGTSDRFESQKIDFFQKVRTAYLARAAEDPDRITIIDATQPLAVVCAKIKAEIESLLPAK